MEKNILAEVMNLLDQEKANEARLLFDKLETKETVEYLLVKGRLEQKFQNFGEALNSFSEVLELDSENIEAKNSIHLIQNILNFWNPEMFNP